MFEVVSSKTFAMRRLFTFIVCFGVCTLCGPYVQVSAQTSKTPPQSMVQHPVEPTAERRAHHAKMQSMTHEERVAHRQAKQAEFEKYIDSVVLSHNFEFNPQSVQMMPAGSMQFLSNPNYTMTLWRSTLDVCLPYWVGYVPPYRYVLLNTVTPNIGTITTRQTDEGWTVTFRVNLYATDDYDFTLDINSRFGGATLTISNAWYNPVQYTGTITRVY